jgi:hypothetical protein
MVNVASLQLTGVLTLILVPMAIMMKPTARPVTIVQHKIVDATRS